MQESFANFTRELQDAAAIEAFELYECLVAYGKRLDEMPPEERIPSNFVYGCVSNVYIAASLEKGCMYYRACSDAMTVRGYIYILITAMNGLPASAIASTREFVEKFVLETNVAKFLTPTRSNAFANVYELMCKHAENLS